MWKKMLFMSDSRRSQREWRFYFQDMLGEAASCVPDDIRAAHTDIPWRMIVATRNRLIRAYLGIDDDTIWSIIQDDLPDLIPKLKKIV